MRKVCLVVSSRLRVVEGGAVPRGPLATDPWEYQAQCVDAFVLSWTARGFSPVTIDNDTRRAAGPARPAAPVADQPRAASARGRSMPPL